MGENPQPLLKECPMEKKRWREERSKSLGLNEGENRLSAKWTWRILVMPRIHGVSKVTSATKFTDQTLSLLKSG